jgi:hypothetical protein
MSLSFILCDVVFANVLSISQKNTQNIGYLMSTMDSMISFLNNSFTQLNKQILDVARSYDAKMFIMEDLIKNNCKHTLTLT